MPLALPFLGNKFSPKKGPLRKSSSLSNLNLDPVERQAEFGVDYTSVKLKLGGNEMVFDPESGLWITESGGGGASFKETQRLKHENKLLYEENNLLKLKLEILLDMLATRTAEMQLQENEIDQLKNLKKR